MFGLGHLNQRRRAAATAAREILDQHAIFAGEGHFVAMSRDHIVIP
jgi:hypothetical protein